MSLKNSISTPLEAGTSILDTHNLPTNLNDALEYASHRLARKSLHVPLVAVRRDYQTPSAVAHLPVTPSYTPTSFSSPPTSPTTLSMGPRLGFAASLRQRLSPILTSLSLGSARSDAGSSAASPTWSVGSEAPSGTWSKPSWPCTPATPATPMSVPPMTPSTTACSSAATDAGGPMSPSSFGIRLVHADVPCPREEKAVREVLEKARRKYGLGTNWLPSPAHPSTYSLPDCIIRRSLVQNDVLFSSEGLTLYSLDRLYTFKSALASYSRSRLPSRLEDAVDELRRLVLASGGRKVARADVLRSYDWLGVGEAALAEVDAMYRRAYGGVDGLGAIDGVKSTPYGPGEDGRFGIAAAVGYGGDGGGGGGDDGYNEDIIHLGPGGENLPMLLFPSSPIETLTPIFKTAPLLRLQTTFTAPRESDTHLERGGKEEEGEEEEEELTARPERQGNMWTASIDEVLVPKAETSSKHLRPGSGDSRVSERLGPTTPHGYEDISPVTRGEWGFLFTDAGFGVRTAAVETC